MEAGKQQPDAGQGQPQTADRGGDHQRVVEVLAPGVVHDVQHPEHIEQAPGLVAVVKHLARLRRQVHRGVLAIVGIHAPQSAFVIAYLTTPLQQARCFQRTGAGIGGLRQACGPGRVQGNGLAGHGVGQGNALGIGQLIDRGIQQPARTDATDFLVSTQETGRRTGIGRPLMGRMLVRLELMALHLIVVQPAHHHATGHPKQQLQADDQADPFVQRSHPGRHAAALLRKL